MLPKKLFNSFIAPTPADAPSNEIPKPLEDDGTSSQPSTQVHLAPISPSAPQSQFSGIASLASLSLPAPFSPPVPPTPDEAPGDEGDGTHKEVLGGSYLGAGFVKK